jgi:hypothetical protein
MSTLINKARSAVFRDGQIVITLATGNDIRFPVAENARLAKGTEAQLNRVEISPYGIHWPELDEDLSFEGLLRGDYGQHRNLKTGGAANGK